METTLIILSYNTAEYSKSLIKSALCFGIEIKFIMVVDNFSPDKDHLKIKKAFDNELRVIRTKKNLGYGKAFNYAVQFCDTKFVCFLNSDIIFLNNPFPKLQSTYFSKKNCGILGVKQLYPDLSPQRSHGYYLSLKEILSKIFFLHKLLPFWNIFENEIQKVEYVDGALIFTSLKNFESINGFDDDFFFYFEDMDLSKRMNQKGLKNFIINDQKIIHERGFSTNKRGSKISDFSIHNFNKSLIIYVEKNLKIYKNIYYFLLLLNTIKQLIIHSFLKTKTSDYNIIRNKSLIKTIFKSK